jgi:OOP family OmpA-OmpF porin
MVLKRWVVRIVALVSCCIGGPAIAQNAYIGVSAGLTTANVCNDLSGLGLTSCDDEGSGFKIFGGYKFNQNFGVEASLVDLGEFSATGPGGTASVGVDGFGVAAVGMIPISQKFDIFGKVGIYMWDASGGGVASGISDDGSDIMFGAGVNWSILNRLGLRAEWERFDVDGDDVDFISIGAQFNF